MKRAQKQIFNLMLDMIDEEISLMTQHGNSLDADELKFRLHLTVDKLDFIQAVVECGFNDSDMLEKINKLNERLIDWFGMVFENPERSLVYSELEKGNLYEAKILLKLEDSKTFYNDFGDEITGLFIYSSFPIEQLDLFKKSLSCDNSEDRLKYSMEFLFAGNKNPKERLSILEKLMLSYMLK